ncbi:glycosyltransferase [Pseudomonas saudiphocaensis]|uniref:glycosyltransferase n=1 Tax=Pseudomonas saudiphocaensis TaxID=1499686 RepID=UPI000F7862AF|nr:glycosyltransferase [Pseudomonas saudiphocaensis]RRV13649.1 glycosyltransferase [Pseudomonas saudiphocaensis]
MKIKFLTRYPRDLITGGAEAQAAAYIKELIKLGHTASIDTKGTIGEIDILHLVGLSVDFSYIAQAAKSKGIKVVTSPNFLYSNVKSYVAQILAKNKFANVTVPYKYCVQLKNSDAVIVNSQYEKKHIERVFGTGKLTVIRNGAYHYPKLELPQLETELESLGLENKRFIFCCAMIDERKNTLRGLEAYLEAGTSLPLILAGDYRGSESYNRSVSLLIEANKSKIKHLGLVTSRASLTALYQGAALHYLPSHFETPGLSSLESLAMDTKILVGDCPPVREYFNQNVIFANSKCAKNIAKCIDEGLGLSFTGAGLPSELYWENIGKGLVETYEKILT